MKRTPLRKASTKRSRELARYQRRMNAYFHKHIWQSCEYPECWERATEVHHIKGRHGEMLNDECYWMFICAEHHRWIHNNGREARKMKLLQ